MSHLHPKPPRKKKHRGARITQSDIDKATRAFKERGGFIKKLPAERILPRRKVGVGFMQSSPYEDVSGVDVESF